MNKKTAFSVSKVIRLIQCFSGSASFLLLGLLLWSSYTFESASNTGPLLPQIGDLSSDQMNEDFLVFKGALEEMHPGLYRYHSKTEVDTYFESIERSLTREMTALEFYRELLGFISDIGCGHTWIHAPELLDDKLRSREGGLPLDLKIIGKDLYSLSSYHSNLGPIDPGSQIMSINGHPFDQLLNQFLEYTVGDGYIESGRIRMIERRFNFYYTLVYGQIETYTITFRNRANKEFTIDLPARDLEDFEQKKDNNNDTTINQSNIAYEIHGNETAYLKISSFGNWNLDGKEVQFENELKNLFNWVDSLDVVNMILDLRDNRGGSDSLGLLTLSYLLDQPVVEFKQLYLKSVNPSFIEFTDLDDEFVNYLSLVTRRINDTTFVVTDQVTTSPYGPSRPNYSGKLYVLINGNTFSTAADVAAMLHFQNRAEFIGTETGGGYNGNSSGYFVNVTLPNSKFKMQVPLIGYVTNVDENVPLGRGVLPDYPVNRHITDVIDGRDAELMMAFELTEDQKSKGVR